MAKNNQYPYWQVHDKFFKEMFMYPVVIKSFVEQYLMQELDVHVNLERIIPVRTESVDTKLRALCSDLIFELNTFSDKPIYLLFEHKSYPVEIQKNNL